jgi:hypothetical protein
MNRQLVGLGLVALLAALTACTNSPPTPLNVVSQPNLDQEMQALIAKARRVVFIVPFSLGYGLARYL